MEEGTEKNILNADVQNNTRKRRFPSGEQNKEDSTSKYACAPENKFRLLDGPRPFQLLDFSDEMLFEIFQYLDTWTIMALMNSCMRLSSFILDHRFWNFIDLSKEPLPLGILEDVLERSHANTVSIKLHGPPISQHIEGEDKQFSITLAKVFSKCCTNLSTLELQGITIDFRHIRIIDFPASLKRLLLNNCNVRFEGEKSIFFGIETHLTNLEELAIENSNWFEPYYIMVFSKVPQLRSLSLKGCQLLSDFVPYGSMAARFGFQKLEHLDLRFTPISDSDLQCFNAVLTLKEILLDCPETLREKNEDDAQKTAGTKAQNCYCPARHQNENFNHLTRSQSESPSTSSAAAAAASSSSSSSASSSSSSSAQSQWKVTVSLASNCSANNNGVTASTSSAAATATAAATEPTPSTSSCSHSPMQYALQVQRDDDFSVSSCSSSPSGSSSSSNESLPSLLANSSSSPSSASARLAQNNIELPIPGGNVPPFSRFLPRPDQIILLDLNNRWRTVMRDVSRSRQIRAEVQQQIQQQQPNQQPEILPQQPQAQRHRHAIENNIINNNNNNNNNAENNNNNNNGNGNQIERVLSHPLFWDMINPFARVGPGVRRNGREDNDESPFHDTPSSRRYDCRRSQCSGQYHQYHRHRHRLHHPISDRGICCFGRPRNPIEHGMIWIRVGNRPSDNRFERLSVRNYKMVTDISLQHLVQCSPYLVYLDLSGTSVTQRGVDIFKENKPECTIKADHLCDAPIVDMSFGDVCAPPLEA